jgi:hypothetical protein
MRILSIFLRIPACLVLLIVARTGKGPNEIIRGIAIRGSGPEVFNFLKFVRNPEKFNKWVPIHGLSP